jgi:predicted ATPase
LAGMRERVYLPMLFPGYEWGNIECPRVNQVSVSLVLSRCFIVFLGFPNLLQRLMIQQIRIQNFRSLKDVTLDLQQVNLLIGPNNSGKTNVLKALSFFYHMLFNEQMPFIDDETFRRTIFNNYSKQINNKLGELIVFTLNFENNDDDYFCQIELQRSGRRRGIIGVRHNAKPMNEYLIGDGRQTVGGHFLKLKRFIVFDPAFLVNHTDFKSAIAYLREAFEELLIYRIDPKKLFDSVIPSYEKRLNSDSSNIIPFLFGLSQNYKKRFMRLESDLERCIGDIVSVSTPPDPTEEGKLKLKFFDSYENDYWVDEVSEGVLYFLALLCIIHQPDPPKLLLLEEPEKGIHPRRIREVMDFIFDLAQEKNIQVIMTTHDTYVVDQFADIPEAVFVFDKKEGATEVKNLQRDVIDPANKQNEENGLPPTHYTQSLGEHWAAGFLGGVPR